VFSRSFLGDCASSLVVPKSNNRFIHEVSMHRRILPALCATLLGACLCSAATAQFEELSTAPVKPADQLFTGTQLYKHRWQRSWVRAYVAGVIDSNAGLAARDRRPLYCLPANGTLAEYTDIFVGYLSANPQIRQEAGPALVRESLSAAFACASDSR
jgi:hypothetical protein